ncbi:PREDICTED: histone acetyltransferase KAT6B-like [Nelumbo nucifera]|uniref:Histone acetyltransferase KAT6B-like n=1 Tax=Nelumbo nucifera TaxID=4432 RepID=A0A1U8BL83_NELNU|nr:PREDICTED: histone acetyltransferase KAT6B-like [Nelumbo nucifera]
MTKKRYRRPRTRSQVEDLQEQQQEEDEVQNPKMVEDESSQPSESQSPNLIGVGQSQSPEGDQNPQVIEEEPSQPSEEDQNLKSVEDEPAQPSEVQNPKLVEDHPSRPSEDQNQEVQEIQEIEDPEDQSKEKDHFEEIEDDEEQQPLHEGEGGQEEDEEEPEGMSISPTLPPPPLAEDITIPDVVQDNPTHPASNVSRKAPKKKKSFKNRKRPAFEKKLQTLKENMKPIPFSPCKTLDFSKHEKLLKRLGLWDFAHLELDCDIRTDLLAQLVVNYNPAQRCSFVNESRIKLNRADLGRALKLPGKKDKTNSAEASESEPEVLSEESISFIEEFVSNWFILHEDTWILPDEIVTWNRLIREGQPQKVDWAGLIWFMVEKELLQASDLTFCYYAPHLQYLMKSQKKDLFEDVPKEEIDPKEEQEEDAKEEVFIKEEGEGDAAAEMKMCNLDDIQGQESDKQEIELTLGQGKIEIEQQARDEDLTDFQECKGEEEPGQWLLDGKNNDGEHFLQRCNLNEVEASECQRENKEEKEMEEEDRYGLSSKGHTLEQLSSTELIQAMGTANVYNGAPVNLVDHSSGDLLAPRADPAIHPGGPSIFGNSCKREISHEDDVHHHTFGDHHKRMRNNGPWDNKSFDFDTCMEQAQNLIHKARMMHAAREQAYMNANVDQQFLITELENRQRIIQELQNSKIYERQKGQLEIYRLERELYVMDNLLNGYKKALKETRRAFAEYRERFPQPEEPLYKDVGGPGGDVLTSTELEKLRLEREEEEKLKRLIAEQQLNEFQVQWYGTLEQHLETVQCLDNRLLDLEKEVKLLKEKLVKRKSVLECSVE